MKKRNTEEKIQNLTTIIKNNAQHIPEQTYRDILKQAEIVRKSAKPKRSNKGRNQNQNSGLLKPVIISEEMAAFANWGKEELHSRVDVTKIICNYVKINKLQKPTNKKTIIPDENLQKLLRWKSDDEEMTISIINITESDEEKKERVALVSISKEPNIGLRKIQYYNNTELRNLEGEELAIIKKMEPTEDGNYNVVLDKEKSVIETGNSFTIHVPLTYPKIQTKISIHLTKPEEEKKEVKPSKPKKEKKEKKKNKDSSDEDN
jgi:hypothetical protein